VPVSRLESAAVTQPETATIETLAQVPLFRTLNRRALERVAKVVRPVVFPPGFEIVKEGDDGLGFFLIQEGQVEVVKGGVKLNTLGPPEYFGEMSMLDDEPRVATVRALEETRCLAIYRWDFLSEARTNMDLAMALLAGLSQRLRELDARLAEQ
jgi:CRP/FNR family cyclic AMP-dependent transcriptional regulator